MKFDIVEIADPVSKSKYADMVLRSLPDWFGIEEAIIDYVEQVKDLPFWIAADEKENCIGFLAVKVHYGHTGDIFVCGVLPECHRTGIGKRLFAAADDHFIKNGCRYVIVKTLSEITDYAPYEATRRFYMSVGFEPLITLTEMWDEQNPCLIMIKKLKRNLAGDIPQQG